MFVFRSSSSPNPEVVDCDYENQEYENKKTIADNPSIYWAVHGSKTPCYNHLLWSSDLESLYGDHCLQSYSKIYPGCKNWSYGTCKRHCEQRPPRRRPLNPTPRLYGGDRAFFARVMRLRNKRVEEEWNEMGMIRGLFWKSSYPISVSGMTNSSVQNGLWEGIVPCLDS